VNFGKKIIQGQPENDPDWIKEIAFYVSDVKKEEFSDNDKKFLRELFFEYQQDGLSPRDAIAKAKNVILSFKN
jgi:hypothetical protein